MISKENYTKGTRQRQILTGIFLIIISVLILLYLLLLMNPYTTQLNLDSPFVMFWILVSAYSIVFLIGLWNTFIPNPKKIEKDYYKYTRSRKESFELQDSLLSDIDFVEKCITKGYDNEEQHNSLKNLLNILMTKWKPYGIYRHPLVTRRINKLLKIVI